MVDYQKRNRRMSVVIIASCFVVVASFFLMDWQWLTYTNYQLHEMMGIPVLAGYFLIPVEIVAGIVFFIQYRRKSSKSIKNMALNILAVVSVAACIAAVTYFNSGGTYSSFEDNVRVYDSNRKYYIDLNNIPFEITEAQYHLMRDGESYSYMYEYKKWLGKDFYKLSFLKLLDEQ